MLRRVSHPPPRALFESANRLASHTEEAIVVLGRREGGWILFEDSSHRCDGTVNADDRVWQFLIEAMDIKRDRERGIYLQSDA